MYLFSLLFEEEKASSSVLFRFDHVQIAAIPPNHVFDVAVKCTVKGQGRRCLFKWLTSY